MASQKQARTNDICIFANNKWTVFCLFSFQIMRVEVGKLRISIWNLPTARTRERERKKMMRFVPSLLHQCKFSDNSRSKFTNSRHEDAVFRAFVILVIESVVVFE